MQEENPVNKANDVITSKLSFMLAVFYEYSLYIRKKLIKVTLMSCKLKVVG